MTSRSRTWSLMLAAALALGGCAVVPVDDYGYYEDDAPYYARETVIVTPPPRVEYRGLPPAAGYIWIDGYWNWIGHRHDWVPGYWSPPGARPIVRHRHFERDRDDDRRGQWWREHRNTRDADRRDDHADRKRWRDDARREGDRDGWPRRGDARERLHQETERRRTRDSEGPRRFEGRPIAPQAAPAGDARRPPTASAERDGPRGRDGARGGDRETRTPYRRDDGRPDGRVAPGTEDRGERRRHEDGRPPWRDRLRETGTN